MQASLTLHLVWKASWLYPGLNGLTTVLGKYTTINFCLPQPTVQTAVIILNPLLQRSHVSQHNNAMLNGEFESNLLLVVLHASFQSKPDSHEVAVGFARLFLVFSLWILALQKDFLFLGNPTSLRQRLLLVFDSGFRMTRTYDTTTLQLLSCSEWSAVIESCFLLKKTHLLQTPDRAAGLKTASVVMLESTLTSVSRYTFLWYWWTFQVFS